MELSIEIAVALVISAFFCEYLDSTLGMGYGTTLTPVFLLMGFTPMQIVPTILLSELFTGVLAGVCHHREGNVNFRPQNKDVLNLKKMLKPISYLKDVRRSFPMHLKIALLIAACSGIGTVGAVFVAVNIPKFWLKMYIGCLVLLLGIVILMCGKREFKFSFKRITFLSLLASFNKGMSGGGYGPVVTSGQILAGVDSKSAIGITSLAEGLTCFVGLVMYFLVSKSTIDWVLAPYVIFGAILSVPLSAKSVKFVSNSKLKLMIGILTIVLGSLTIYKTLR